MNPLFKQAVNLMGNNTNNPILNMAMNSLRGKNPQGFNELQQMMNTGQNPEQIAQKMLGNANPQQVANIKNMASMFGVDLGKYIK